MHYLFELQTRCWSFGLCVLREEIGGGIKEVASGLERNLIFD